MERIQSEQQYRDTINSDGLTVIKFDTNWCPDCKTLIVLLAQSSISTRTKPSMQWMRRNSNRSLRKMRYAAFQVCSCSRTARKLPTCIANGQKRHKSPSTWRRWNPKYKDMKKATPVPVGTRVAF